MNELLPVLVLVIGAIFAIRVSDGYSIFFYENVYYLMHRSCTRNFSLTELKKFFKPEKPHNVKWKDVFRNYFHSKTAYFIHFDSLKPNKVNATCSCGPTIKKLICQTTELKSACSGAHFRQTTTSLYHRCKVKGRCPSPLFSAIPASLLLSRKKIDIMLYKCHYCTCALKHAMNYIF